MSSKVKASASVRITSGIPGLDNLIDGGFVSGSIILVTGATGTGKTTFCAQYLMEGLKKGEPCIYITLEESPEEIKHDMKMFGLNFDKYEKSGLFKIFHHNPFEVSDISSLLSDEINEMKAKRVVLDPVSLIGMYVSHPAVLRKRMVEIAKALKRTDATVIITSEIEEEQKGLSRFGVVEFVVDVVIVMQYLDIGEQSFGNLQIRKMRRTKHAHGWFPLDIVRSGLKVSKEGVSTVMK